MNILHHKSWHVRNKDNIERVRRDEDNARKEEEERLRKVALAESEARTGILRERAKVKQRNDDEVYEEVSSQATSSKHINFFADEEEGIKKGGVNDEHEKERKEEQEKREKAIGLLTYLGQSAVEGQTVKPWYFTAPVKKEHVPPSKQLKEADRKKKSMIDPMHVMNRYMSTKRKVEGRLPEPVTKKPRFDNSVKIEKKMLKVEESDNSSPEQEIKDKSKDKKKKKKHKKHKNKEKKSSKKRKHKDSASKDEHKNRSSDSKYEPSQSTSSSSLEQLRAERLRRELAERQKTKQLFATLRGEKSVSEREVEKNMDDRKRGYNSQFNPELARKPKKKKDWHNMI